MLKYLVFAVLLCGVAQAGVIGHHVVAVAHGATSYQNNNQLSVHPVPVVGHVAHHAPIAVAHAPIAVAHAPIAVAHAPIAVAHAAPVAIGIGHGWH